MLLEEARSGGLPRAAQKPVRFSQGAVTPRAARRKGARRDNYICTPYQSLPSVVFLTMVDIGDSLSTESRGAHCWRKVDTSRLIDWRLRG